MHAPNTLELSHSWEHCFFFWSYGEFRSLDSKEPSWFDMLNLESYRGLWSLYNGPCRKWVFKFSGQGLEVRPTLQNIKEVDLSTFCMSKGNSLSKNRFPRIFAKLPIKKYCHCQVQRPKLKGLFFISFFQVKAYRKSQTANTRRPSTFIRTGVGRV